MKNDLKTQYLGLNIQWTIVSSTRARETETSCVWLRVGFCLCFKGVDQKIQPLYYRVTTRNLVWLGFVRGDCLWQIKAGSPGGGGGKGRTKGARNDHSIGLCYRAEKNYNRCQMLTQTLTLRPDLTCPIVRHIGHYDASFRFVFRQTEVFLKNLGHLYNKT